MVLCDSHGLQLLIEAIVSKHQGISDIMEKAQAIVAAFAHSKLQFAILRRHQTDCYGRTKGLIAVSFLRWSTQYGVVSSLLRSKEALQRYGLDQRAALKGRQHMLVDRAFWNDLEDVEMMLRPLNEAQRQSKSDGAHIGFLISRWMKMKDELERLYETGKFPQLASIIGPEGEPSQRFERYTGLHIA